MCPDEPKKPEGVIVPESTQEKAPNAAVERRQQSIGEEVTAVMEPLSLHEASELVKRAPALLMVDDHPFVIKTMKRVLGPYVSDREIIETFHDPQEAFQRILELPQNSVIVSDNSMGATITGVQLAALVQGHAADKNFVFVLQTGDGLRPEFSEALKNGSIDQLVHKPFSPQELVAAIAQGLKKKLPSEDEE